MKNPVILIPGLQGTKLADINRRDFKTKWSGFRALFDNLYDLFLRPDGITDASGHIVIEREDVEDLAYKDVINMLKHEDYPLYIFGYDWRKSCVENATKLADFIKVTQKKCETNGLPKVSFITHSNGAMVLSAYLKSFADPASIDSVVDRIIFTAPPFLGSVEAIFNLVIGKSRLFNSSDDFRKLARTLPAIYELCPVYTGSAKRSDNKKFALTNLAHWQANLHANTMMKSRLKDLSTLRDANQFIFDLDALSAALKANILVIAGTGEDSQYHFEIDNNDNNLFTFPKDPLDDPRKPNGGGDGTVHLASARPFENTVCTLTVQSNWFETRLNSKVISYNWHSFMLNNGRVQTIIKRFLKGPEVEDWYKTVGKGVDKIGTA